MTLVVETGTVQDETTESYASAADADAYVTKWHNDVDWSAASTPDKERALRKGTRFVDSHEFVGLATDPDQATDWPRGNVGSIDGRIIASNEIPLAIKRAAMEAALRIVQGETLQPDHDGGTVRSESKQVGSLSTQTEFATARRAAKTFEAIDALLRPYLARSQGLTRAI